MGKEEQVWSHQLDVEQQKITSMPLLRSRSTRGSCYPGYRCPASSVWYHSIADLILALQVEAIAVVVIIGEQ